MGSRILPSVHMMEGIAVLTMPTVLIVTVMDAFVMKPGCLIALLVSHNYLQRIYTLFSFSVDLSQCPESSLSQELVADGQCDGFLNNAECSFDGGDCCIEQGKCEIDCWTECKCHLTGKRICMSKKHPLFRLQCYYELNLMYLLDSYDS